MLGIDTALQLAQAWFGDYASPEWKRKTPDQAVEIFRALELDAGFWNISSSFR